jgi:hypothetical protein
MNSGHVQALFFCFMPISFRFPESRHVAGGIQTFISIYAPYKNVFCKQCNVDSTYDIEQKQSMQTFPHRTTDTQIGGILIPSTQN